MWFYSVLDAFKGTRTNYQHGKGVWMGMVYQLESETNSWPYLLADQISCKAIG
jgi:hypothetical protein